MAKGKEEERKMIIINQMKKTPGKGETSSSKVGPNAESRAAKAVEALFVYSALLRRCQD